MATLSVKFVPCDKEEAINGWYCTRRKNHEGPHIASDDDIDAETIYCIWAEEAPVEPKQKVIFNRDEE